MSHSSGRASDYRSRALIWIFALCMVAPGLLRAQELDTSPPVLERLAALEGEWRAGSSSFRSTLHFQRSHTNAAVRVWNEVTREGGGRIAFYDGIYFWDPARAALRFVTVASGGELHEGEVYWRDDMIWHDSRVSGSSLTSFRSSLRLVDGMLEYRAVYGTLAPHAEVLAATPLVYRRPSS